MTYDEESPGCREAYGDQASLSFGMLRAYSGDRDRQFRAS